MAEKAFSIKFNPKMNGETKGLLRSLSKSAGGVAGGLGAAAGAAGPAGIMAALVASLKVFEPIRKIAGQIVNMLGEFLRPISDVILLLLRPILQILRPILLVVRQIMAPFRQAAFALSRQAGQAFREGDMARGTALVGLSIAEIAVGIQAVGLFFMKEMLKTLIDSFGQLFGPLFSFFGIEIDNAVKLAKDAIDFAAGTLIAAQAFAIATAAQALGADISTEFTAQVAVLKKFFVGEDNSFSSTFKNFTDKMIDSLIPEMDGALNSMINSFEGAAARIRNINTQAERSERESGNSRTSNIIRNQITSAVTRGLPIL